MWKRKTILSDVIASCDWVKNFSKQLQSDLRQNKDNTAIDAKKNTK